MSKNGITGNGAGGSGVLLEDLLKENGDEDLFDAIMKLSAGAEEDPPIFFGWEKVHNFVRAIHDTQADTDPWVPVPAPPFELPDRVDVEQFKETILEYARAEGSQGPIRTAALPCTMAECCQVMMQLQKLDSHDWIRHIVANGHDVLPLATIYVPRPRSNMLDVASIYTPNSIWHA